MKKKFLGWIICVVIGISLVAGSAFAAGTVYNVQKSIPGSMVVVKLENLPPDSIGSYSDSSLTTPLEKMSWGTMFQGEYNTISFYLVNEADETYQIGHPDLSGSPEGWSWSIYDSAGKNVYNPILAPGDVVKATLTVYTSKDTPEGTYNFVVTLQGRTITDLPVESGMG